MDTRTLDIVKIIMIYFRDDFMTGKRIAEVVQNSKRRLSRDADQVAVNVKLDAIHPADRRRDFNRLHTDRLRTVLRRHKGD